MNGRTTRAATGLTDTAHIILARCTQGLYPGSMAGVVVLERTPTHRYRVAEQLWRVHLPRPSLSARIAAEQIEREIQDGWHPAGRELPSLSAVSSAIQMSAADVKRALHDLGGDGLTAMPQPGRPAMVLYEAAEGGTPLLPHLADRVLGTCSEEPSCPDGGR
ncbi:hypothetical protein AB0G42_15990 [Streptomyces yangpuensis]|uniref:hypothetical protein n=1 Tax=Streptomyces yangpuensis TaxID=1648182 RepID=UPI003413D573